MQWIKLSYQAFSKSKHKLIRFFRKYGDHRITKEGITWIRQATQKDYESQGTIVLCVVEHRKIVGIIIVVEYGTKESFIAVHKDYRNQKLAHKMIAYILEHLGKMYARVALDNIPSLKICLDNEMVAFNLFTGPTGKPTVWVAGGNWSREDIIKP